MPQGRRQRVSRRAAARRRYVRFMAVSFLAVEFSYIITQKGKFVKYFLRDGAQAAFEES
jgi:hypothetical protein